MGASADGLAAEEAAQGREMPQVRLVRGGSVFRDGAFVPGDVRVEGGRVAAGLGAAQDGRGGAREGGTGGPAGMGGADQAGTGGAREGEVLDASGCYVIPGLLDLHFHGCMGDDLSDADPQGLRRMAAHEARAGVTAICPASMTLPRERLEAVMANAAAFSPGPGEADLVGVNMEGPYISPGKVGAQNPAYVRPASAEEFRALQEAARGLIKLVDVAPEEPGNLDFIREVAGEARVSLAHTCADYECARAAFRAGARHMTHLYNAMPGLRHREPGPIAAAVEEPGVTAELIADGVHVHPAMARLAFRMFGAGRMVLISDSLRACGMPDGTYELGGQLFSVKGPRATLPDGTLAGSVTDLMGCLHTAVLEMGVPLADAVRAASANPARALGVEADFGSLEPGRVASLAVLEPEGLRVRHVVLRGRLLV